MSADLVILVPVLDRPHRVAPLLDSIEAATPEAKVLFLCDREDAAEMAAIEEQQRLGRAPRVRYDMRGGSYAQKVNLGVELTEAPLVFLAADDLDFKPGWLEAAMAAMSGGAAVVGVNDLLRRRPRRVGHATHFLMTREYAERPCLDGERGPCSEAYLHNFVDDELIATAKARGVYAYARGSHVAHLHWMNRRAEVDATYEKGRETFEADRRTFESRRHLWG